MACTTLAHLIDVDRLREAYRRTRKDGAPGIDGVTAQAYAEPLDAHLANLHERLRSGRYRAPPVRRTSLDQKDGSQRPLGIPAFEDQLVQRAVVMLLGAIYEQDCWDGSHGVRDGHSPHQALHELREQGMALDIGWIVDAEVSAFFESLDHDLVRERLRPRIADGRMIGLIGKWLKAGVVEGDALRYPERGNPQGGVGSPLLANILLHGVLDAWFEREVTPRRKGRCFLIRFAADFVSGCEREEDARRMMAVLPKRCTRCGLTMHPQQTRLVAFRKPARRGKAGLGNGTFEFLGCTHACTQSRRGYWVIKRGTAKKRRRRARNAVGQWGRNHRHDPLREQHRTRSRRLRGHSQDYGIRGHDGKLEALYEWVDKAWRDWLSRRRQPSAIPGRSSPGGAPCIRCHTPASCIAADARCRAATCCARVVPRLSLLRNRMRSLRWSGSVGGLAGNRRVYPEADGETAVACCSVAQS